MAQADLASFIPISTLFLLCFFLPILVETSWSDDEGMEWYTAISISNLRRASF